jgi:hypothetical protein
MKKTSRYISLLLALVLALTMAVPAAAESAFSDVKAGVWYEPYVTQARNDGLISGVSADKFAPDGTLSIAQAVTLSARMYQKHADGTVTLKNGDTTWYAPYVDYAVEKGIIASGEYDGRWTATADRAEFIEIFYKALPESEYAAKNTVEDGAVPDVALNDDWGAEVYSFYRAGILTGDARHYFNPGTSIKRSEAAAVMARMFTPSLRQSVTLTSAFGKLPGFNDAATKENLLALTSAYDSDGKFILQFAMNSGEDIARWGGGTALNMINTSVHEETHFFTHSAADYDTENIYLGGGKKIVVRYTQVFPSKEMGAQIPQNLRTFRYDTYVGPDADSDLSANVHGPYGLLNEFAAYCWGTNTSVKLFDYYKTLPQTPDTWFSYVQSAGSTFAAYAEFKYYILEYLIYAQANYPDVYKAIIANDNFKTAFNAVDATFTSVISEYMANLDRIETIMTARGYSTRQADGYFWIGNTGVGISSDDYDTLMTEMAKPVYQNMLKTLKN